MIKGIVAIVGRPNVGKSTLFNRLTRNNNAIVDDRPGVTRDRLYGIAKDHYDPENGFIVIDTGGFTRTQDDGFDPQMIWRQTQHAIAEADLVLMVFDTKAGLHPLDTELVLEIKKREKKALYVANKVDGPEQAPQAFEFYRTGINAISNCCAAHNRGVGAIIESIFEQLATASPVRSFDDGQSTKVAIIGRPNAGKSSILNRLAGEEKALVTDIPGTTRDAVDIHMQYNQNPYTFVDTAGIRRKSRISEKIETMSVIRSLRAIEKSDVIMLVLDASGGLKDQDAKLATIALAKYKPLIIVVNKWDLIPNKTNHTLNDYRQDIYHKIKNMTFVPIVFVSCLKNQRVHQLMSLVESLQKMQTTRIGTSQVNEVLQKAVREHTPSLNRRSNRRAKFYYATQVSASPPTIVVKCNVAEDITESYRRFLTKRLRVGLQFESIPLRIFFRSKDEEKSRKRR